MQRANAAVDPAFETPRLGHGLDIASMQFGTKLEVSQVAWEAKITLDVCTGGSLR